NAKYETLTLGGLMGTGSLALDVDLKENTNDKLVINSAIDSGVVIFLESLNIVAENISEAPSLSTDIYDPIEIAALGDNAKGKIAVSLVDDVKTIVTDCYKYVFKAEKDGNDKWTGNLSYTRTDSTINLTKYIEHEIDTYTFQKNIAVEKDKYLIGIVDAKGANRREVKLDMYGFDLIGYVDGTEKKTNGVQINKDGNLIVNGTHTDDETGNTNNSIIKDFDTAFKNYGTLTLKDVTLSGNNVGVDNGFTISDTKPVLNIDCTDAAHPMEFTDKDTVINSENAVVNVLGDLIVNKGSMTGGSVCVSTTETTSGTKGTLILKTTTEDWDVDFKILQGTSGTNSVVVIDENNTKQISIGNFEERYNETWFDAKELQVNAATNAVVSTLGENLDKVAIKDEIIFNLDNKTGEDSKAAFSVSGGTMIVSNKFKNATSKTYWLEDKDADGNFLYKIDSKIIISEKVEKVIGLSDTDIYNYTGIMQANASQLTGMQDIENAGILILTGGTLGRDVVKGQHIVYEYEGSRKYEAGEVKDGFPQTEEVFGKVVVTPEEVTIGDGVNNVKVEETIYGSIDSGTNNVININLNGGTVAQIIGGRGTSDGSVVSGNIITINATDKGGEVTGYEDSSGVDKKAAVYGGIGDSAKNNQVNINGGSYLHERVVGGNGNNEIENNTITITGGTFGSDVDIKAGSGKGIVKENIVTISGGTFASDQILGAEVHSATAEGNGVSISGGTFSSSSKDITWIAGVEGDVRKDKQSTITNNFVEISDGSFDVSKDNTIIAGAMDDPEATMETGFSGNTYDGNSVTISGGTFTVQDTATLSIYGAKSVKGNVNNSVVEISDVEIQANIYGGETSDGAVSGGTINISNAKVTGDVVGGLITGTTGTVKNNVLTISGSEVTGDIYG
ncbi:MAG: hypothetical protein KBS60_05055, partial [Phascolarctobacterium sp.]|nr:hypothetical protein [Candidatus Phascolarctobacterium caballi]